MNSSTSDSERLFVRRALAAFVCGIATLLLPYEMLVRTSERLYGVRRANIVMPRTLSPKIDSFMIDFDNGVRYATYAVGTSRVEASVRPDVLSGFLGPTYNAGFGGVSSIATLEFLDGLGLYPPHLIISVSPMDFTPLGVSRGEKGAALAEWHPSGSQRIEQRGPAAWSRIALRALLHSSTPERHRNLGQWAELCRDHGAALAFLNNEDATGRLESVSARGFVESTKIAAPDEIWKGEWSNIPGEYVSGRPELFPRMAALIRHFQERGTTVALVRIPTSAGVRRAEDAETSFDADIRALSRECGVAYVDGFALMGAAFARDRRNFKDAEHMNSFGALRFSRALGSALTSPGNGPGS